MASITVINNTDAPKDSRAVINTNFSNLNNDIASSAEVIAGTDDVKKVTAKGLKDAGISSGNFLLMQVFS